MAVFCFNEGMKCCRTWFKWLIVFVGLVLLVVMFVPDYIMFRSNHRYGLNAHTRAIIVGFANAIKCYQTEYNRWPVEELAKNDEHILQRTRGQILLTLCFKDDKINPSKILFFEAPDAKDKKRGLYYSDRGEPILADPWGEPYYFVMDLNNDDKVPNPDPTRAQPRELTTTVIVFSSGPDRDPNTWKDNIMSWR